MGLALGLRRSAGLGGRLQNLHPHFRSVRGLDEEIVELGRSKRL
jgi:hypothetical protein